MSIYVVMIVAFSEALIWVQKYSEYLTFIIHIFLITTRTGRFYYYQFYRHGEETGTERLSSLSEVL